MNVTKISKNNQHQLADDLLRKTARSFYLTVHALPRSIQWTISLGYLLARSTDTIADVIALPSHDRLMLLAVMLKMINAGPSEDKMQQLQPSFSTLDPHSAEYILLSHFNHAIEWLYKMDDDTRADIIWVLNKIVDGQRLDIERFSQGKGVSCLHTIADLNNYIYSVAGCVGEFWTKTCLKKIPNYSNQSAEKLYPLAIAFGKGLQLVNILRDIPHDLTQGRCYLPQEQLQQYGLDPDHLAIDIHRLDPVVNYWWQKAVEYLYEGWEYMLSLNHRRIRSAVAMPLMLGFATLHGLKDMSYLTSKKPFKVSRMQVRILAFIAILGMISRKFFSITRVTRV